MVQLSVALNIKQIIHWAGKSQTVFMYLQYMSFENTVGKVEIACNDSNFSFSHSVYYPFGVLSTNFIEFEIVVCKLFQVGRV